MGNRLTALVNVLLTATRIIALPLVLLACGSNPVVTQDQLLVRYMDGPNHKALARASNGAGGAAWGQPSTAAAMQNALDRCIGLGGVGCKITSVDGHAYPSSGTTVDSIGTVYSSYLAGSNNKAYALGSSATIAGAAWGQPSIEIAKQKAMQQCTSTGGYMCRITDINGASVYAETSKAGSDVSGPPELETRKESERSNSKSHAANGEHARTIPYSELVFSVQGLLTEAGYDPGPQDGRAGQKTIRAVEQFQRDAGLEPTGQITQELAALIAMYVSTLEPEAEEVSPSEILGTGSGIVVNTNGHVVTNNHVIDECGSVTVRIQEAQYDARVIAADEPNDLALLKVENDLPASAYLSDTRSAELGQFVMVAGFPLYGLLSEDLIVTSGTVSALAGIGNDRRVLQISAPVQPGNSGGPLMNQAAEVIGTVVSKLDAAKAYEVFGDIPQNINFAIKSSLLRSFLDIYGVDYRTGSDSPNLEPQEIAQKAMSFTALVTCLE